MPNWCQNTATFRHKDPTMIDRVVKGAAGEGILQELLPCPEELQNPDSTTSGGPNAAKYGYESWYDWQIANWGTKWDLCEADANRTSDNSVDLSFESAWSPPVAAYRKLEELGFEVNAYYYEPGMCFCGHYDANGDRDFDIPDTPNEVEKQLPKDIVDAFDIANQMREWMDEDTEELTEWILEGAEARADGTV